MPGEPIYTTDINLIKNLYITEITEANKKIKSTHPSQSPNDRQVKQILQQYQRIVVHQPPANCPDQHSLVTCKENAGSWSRNKEGCGQISAKREEQSLRNNDQPIYQIASYSPQSHLHRAGKKSKKYSKTTETYKIDQLTVQCRGSTSARCSVTPVLYTRRTSM